MYLYMYPHMKLFLYLQLHSCTLYLQLYAVSEPAALQLDLYLQLPNSDPLIGCYTDRTLVPVASGKKVFMRTGHPLLLRAAPAVSSLTGSRGAAGTAATNGGDMPRHILEELLQCPAVQYTEYENLFCSTLKSTH